MGKTAEKRVLIAIYGLQRGGIEMSAIRFQLNMNPEKYSFIYYLQSDKEIDKKLKNDILSSGAKITVKPKHIRSRFTEYLYLKKLIKRENADIVHDHMGFHGGLTARAAYKCGVKKRIVQSHWTADNRTVGLKIRAYRHLMRRFLDKYVTDKLACSADAGVYVFGQDFSVGGKVIKNGIDFNDYHFYSNARQTKRKELGIEESFVIGHIGHLNRVKNQIFLIDIFNEVLQIKPNAVLILAGDAADGGMAEEKAKQLGIYGHTRFLGARSDIPELLSAMDVLVFPSLFEALPLVPIEAQAVKLPCVLSDRVTSEVGVNENVCYIPLECSARMWAEKTVCLADKDRNSVNTDAIRKKFDIKTIAAEAEKIYDS